LPLVAAAGGACLGPGAAYGLPAVPEETSHKAAGLLSDRPCAWLLPSSCEYRCAAAFTRVSPAYNDTSVKYSAERSVASARRNVPEAVVTSTIES